MKHKKQMRIAAVVLLALAMIFILASCGSGDGKNHKHNYIEKVTKPATPTSTNTRRSSLRKRPATRTARPNLPAPSAARS